ncbi:MULTISPECIES: hypothetical protein [Pseudoalteromonas]|uniref:hypothetical protein n=1 Tax=Pseudoalteromonas TaxID=53246 RepID=UPI0021ADA646|nr:hypothetical protein [Pseudoalteromonas flavipulchra]USE69991.1 hypothetical protein CTT31_13000 [Pseudoalteromonas flavipulchra]
MYLLLEGFFYAAIILIFGLLPIFGLQYLYSHWPWTWFKNNLFGLFYVFSATLVFGYLSAMRVELLQITPSSAQDSALKENIDLFLIMVVFAGPGVLLGVSINLFSKSFENDL